MSITLDSIVSVNPEILVSDVEDELIMMNLDQGYYYGLQGVGKRIWDQLEPPLSVRALCAKLQAGYAAQRDTIEREVLAFLADLHAQELITIHAQ